MSKYTIPNEAEIEIIRRNGMDPHVFMVVFSDKDSLHVKNLNTRADVIIHF